VSVARLLRLEKAMAADVGHRLRREREPSSAAEVYKDLLCPDAWHPEYEGDEHTCSHAYDDEGERDNVVYWKTKRKIKNDLQDDEGPMCTGCEAIWRTSRLMVRNAVAASGTPTIRAVAVVMAPSGFQAH